MKATTAGAAVRGGTYLNTKGAEVTIAEDQDKVAPGFVRVIVAGQAFPVPDSLPLFERDATAQASKIDVADLVGKPEATIRDALADLTDEQLDDLANEDGRSVVLRLVTEEQDRRAGLGVEPAPPPAPAPVEPDHDDAPEVAPPADDLPPLADDTLQAPTAADLGEVEQAGPALEPEGWEPRRVTCECCGRPASTEWSVGRASEVLANHRGSEGGHLCAAVGYPPALAANLRPAPPPAPEGSATSGTPDGGAVAPDVDPAAADLGDDTDPPDVQPPTAADLSDGAAATLPKATLPPSVADGADPWNGQEDQAGKIGLIKETSRLDDLDRMARAAGLARIMQEINRQRVAVEEVVRLAGVLVDESQPASKRLAAAEELERIATRERTQISRPGVARLAASYRDAIAALRAQAGSAKALEQAALVRQARTDGPAMETLADYASGTVPPAVHYLHEVMAHGWPAPLVAVLVDLTGGVRACRQALRDLTIAEAATGMQAAEIIEHALALELRGEARETVLADLRSALARRQRGEAEPASKATDEPDQAALEANGQQRLPPSVADGPVHKPDADADGDGVELHAPRVVDADALELARAANPDGLKVVPRPDGADLYVRRGGTWIFVGPVDHADVAPLVQRKAKIEAERPPAPAPAPARRPTAPPAPAQPTATALSVELNPGESPQDLADALSIGRGLLAMQRRGMKVAINLDGGAS